MIYDITPPIDDNLKVWPGDTPPSREVLSHLKDGARTTVSTLHATVHLGAHADAPSHYALDAPSIGERSLDYYIGRCQVITVKAAPRTRIEPEAVPVPVSAQRVLFHTETFPDPTVFNEDFAALAPALIEALAHKGVKLIGIDTPSVDLFDTEDRSPACDALPSHKMLLRYDMANLERIVLTGVPDGIYELIALPLKLMGFDASPVRAILRPEPGLSAQAGTRC